jgi:aldehyde dehydrogenase (NAD+)
MVLKPSEIAPLSGTLFAEILDEAGVPHGVFNLVHGEGAVVGQALAEHPEVDMVSFTGSTRAGKLVARAAADSVKRVAQELGGKSASILLDDADFDAAVTWGVERCVSNGGQTCTAPTRMLVPAARQDEAIAIAQRAAADFEIGDPRAETTRLGPLSSQVQFDKVQSLIETGIAEGAKLVAGGPGRPEHTPRGYFVRPTVFANVTNDMTIAREEIFGPVLCILPYTSEAEAVAIANDSPYGLSGAVHSDDVERAAGVAARMRTGMVLINGAASDVSMPFGGYKQSGNGREWGEFGLEEFLETKSVFGAVAD